VLVSGNGIIFVVAVLKMDFPPKWIRAIDLENLLATHDPSRSISSEIYFQFPQNCSLLIDTAIKVLSLANQLVAGGKSVVMDFRGEALLGYLDRMGFFSALPPQVVVLPERPAVSVRSHRLDPSFRGANPT